MNLKNAAGAGAVWICLMGGMLSGCGDSADGESPAQASPEAVQAQMLALTKKNYNRSCASCHISGVANAPRTGDAPAWQAVLSAKGMDALVLNVRNGYNAMPPMGMCFQCTDEDFRRLIEYMAAPRQN